MHRSVHMLLSASVIALGNSPAFAQESAPVAEQQAATEAAPAAQDAAAAEPENDQAIVVTARKRSEVLQDVPVAVTAVTGETIEKRGLTQIKDVAQLTPSLNVNSDGVGRVFLAVRGVGTTLVGTVQPGVGIFVDGVYQPNTSYLNNPLVDVDRVEVLRGPQGTLYGKNTLGGALNVITRQPSNRFVARAGGSYAGPDNAWDAYGSVSGPIIEDKLQVKVAAAHRQQDGFIRNTLLDSDANSLNMPGVTSFAVLIFMLIFAGTVTGLITSVALTVLLPNELRGLSIGAFIAIAGLIGFGIAPTLVTGVSSLLGGEQHLALALAIVGVLVGVISVIGFWIAMKRAPEAPTCPIGMDKAVR